MTGKSLARAGPSGHRSGLILTNRRGWATGRGLSREQRKVLLALGALRRRPWDQLQALEALRRERGDDAHHNIKDLAWMWARFRRSGTYWASGAWNGSERSSRSRTLRRLEQRGLVVRGS